MIKTLLGAIKEQRYTLLTLTLPFLLLNIGKVMFFHAELVRYEQDFSNVVYVFLFTGAWTAVLFLLAQQRRLWLIVFWVLQFVYISINFSYFYYYGAFLSIRQAVALLPEFYDLSAQMSVPLHPKLLVFLIDLPLLVLILRRQSSPLHGKWIRRSVFALCGILLIMMYVYRLPELESNLLKSKRERFIGSFGLLTMQVSDLFAGGNYYKQLSTDNLPVRSGGPQWAATDGPAESTGESGAQAAAGQSGSVRPKNIIFIQVETLDANVLFAEHEGRPVMPFLSQLAQENIYFPYMLAYHEGGGTSDADFSVMNAVQPLDDYAAINLPAYKYENSVVKRFDAAGYTTSAFHGNVGRYWNRDIAFPKMGFENFYDLEVMGLTEYGWGAKDDDVFAFTADKLGSAAEPLFYYIITKSSHGPFKNIDRYYSTDRFDSLPMDHPNRAYYKAMSYVDESFESFFESGELDLSDTAVFIFGDHTEYYTLDEGTRRAVIRDEGLKLEFVPLIIASDLPAVQAHRGRYDWAVSFLDLAPTALELSGIEYRIRTRGDDVLGALPAAPDEEIPFNGYSFSREKLYDMAAGTR